MKKNKKTKKIEPFDKTDWTPTEDQVFENTIEGRWIQKGPYIINTDTKLEYGLYIGNDKKLIGVDENGKPIIQ